MLAFGGPKVEREDRLHYAGWAWCYQNNGSKLLGSRREYCAWADKPGHIYFSPVDQLTDKDFVAKLRERFAATQEAERNANGSLEEEPGDGDPDDPVFYEQCRLAPDGTILNEPCIQPT
jgi:hypothetical protein